MNFLLKNLTKFCDQSMFLLIKLLSTLVFTFITFDVYSSLLGYVSNNSTIIFRFPQDS